MDKLKMDQMINQLQMALHETEDCLVEDVVFDQAVGKVLFIKSLVDDAKIVAQIIDPIREGDDFAAQQSALENNALLQTEKIADIVNNVLDGCAVVLAEGVEQAYVIDVENEFSRSPEEPENEKVVRGSHEGFVENIDLNILLIRKRIRNPQLMVEEITIGTETNTTVAIVYLADIANKFLVQKITDRVRNISSDMAFSPGFIEEYLEEYPASIFPQMLYTERPDRVGAHMMEGRVAILAEGSADAIIAPVSFFSFFQSPDDYHKRPYVGSLFRILRFISFWGALIFPALYIAIIGYHFEIIPNELITLVKQSIETVPFPPFFEVLIMIITIELIREAGIRLPTSVGQTIGIVGGIIIGESVVNAGLVSNVVVIVVALTAIMSFTIPSYEMGNTIRLLSFPVMISAALFGFVGITLSFIIIFMHLCKLESFGTPYFSPLAPFSLQGMKDAFIRMPNDQFTKRPKYVHPQKEDRTNS